MYGVSFLQFANRYFFKTIISRSHLKNRILAQGQGRTEFQPAAILKYFEELKRGLNTKIGTKDLFEVASDIFMARCGITVNNYSPVARIPPKPVQTQ